MELRLFSLEKWRLKHYMISVGKYLDCNKDHMELFTWVTREGQESSWDTADLGRITEKAFETYAQLGDVGNLESHTHPPKMFLTRDEQTEESLQIW